MASHPYHYSDEHFADEPHTVAGVLYRPGDTKSSMPLGGLGTGSIYFTSRGEFGGQSITNSYRPEQLDSGECGFDVQAGENQKWKPLSETVHSYLAHFPIADLNCQYPDSQLDFELRALSPFIPGDSLSSSIPAALFRFRVHNRGKQAERIAVRFRWKSPQQQEDNGASSIGNVDGFLRWNLGRLSPGKQLEVPVKFLAADTMKDLQILMRNPHGDLQLDENGSFNWENTRQQCLHTKAGGCLSQHGFYLHYMAPNDQHTRKQEAVEGQELRAGSSVIGEQPLENLTRIMSSPDEVKLRTTDGLLELTVIRGDGVITYYIRNVGTLPVNHLQLSVYANLEAGHTESDDHGYLDSSQNALIVTDSSGAACALASDRAPDAGWCGVWGGTIQRMRDNQAISVNEWGNELSPLISTLSHGTSSLAITQETNLHAGCTILGLHDPGVDLTAPSTSREEEEAVIQSVLLAPGETRDLRFALTWSYPDARDNDGKFVGHEYSHRFQSSEDTAHFISERWNDLVRRTGEWQEIIYNDPRLPDGIKDQLVNSLYSLARNTSWLSDGRFTHSESFVGCPITETIVCRFYGSLPLALFFPDLEKNTMRQFIRWQRSDGAIPFAFGLGERWDSPFYDTQEVLDSSEFALLAWRDYYLWKDVDWAREAYPAVKKAIAFARTLDTTNEGLPNDDLSGQYYDCWRFHGVSAYTSGIYLAALKAGAAFGELLNDAAFQKECESLYIHAAAVYQSKLWTGSYYRLWADSKSGQRSDTCLAAQLTGQWYASLCGLGDILPRQQELMALDHIARFNGGHEVWALVNGITPDGSRDQTGTNGHSNTATLGETWNYAATCAWLGKVDLGLPFAERLAEDIALRQRDTWGTSWNMDPDTGEMIWGREYYSNMCVWSLWLALTHSISWPNIKDIQQ